MQLWIKQAWWLIIQTFPIGHANFNWSCWCHVCSGMTYWCICKLGIQTFAIRRVDFTLAYWGWHLSKDCRFNFLNKIAFILHETKIGLWMHLEFVRHETEYFPGNMSLLELWICASLSRILPKKYVTVWAWSRTWKIEEQPAFFNAAKFN